MYDRCGSKRLPLVFGHTVVCELIERVVRGIPEALVVELVEGHTEDPALGEQPGLSKVKEPGDQLPAGQIAGGAEQQNDVRAQGRDQSAADVRRVRSHM